MTFNGGQKNLGQCQFFDRLWAHPVVLPLPRQAMPWPKKKTHFHPFAQNSTLFGVEGEGSLLLLISLKRFQHFWSPLLMRQTGMTEWIFLILRWMSRDCQSFTQCKGSEDSLGFWIARLGFQVLDSRLCQFQSLVWFQNPWAVFWIPKARISDSLSKIFPSFWILRANVLRDSRIPIPLLKAKSLT